MKLYITGPEERAESRELLLRALRLYTWACAEVLEWEAAIHAALRLAERRRRRDMRLTADETVLLAFGRAELAKWQYREIQANRLLAEAEGAFEWTHREVGLDEEAA